MARSPKNRSLNAIPPVIFGVVGDFGSGGWGGPVTEPYLYTVIASAARGVAQSLIECEPEFIVSLGDQVYTPFSESLEKSASGQYKLCAVETQPAAPSDYANAIGNLYGAYIDFSGVPSCYQPLSGATSTGSTMAFYPVLGDHDWWKQMSRSTASGSVTYQISNKDNYQQFFANIPYEEGTKGANIRYYDFTKGGSSAEPLLHFYALSSDPNEVNLGSLASDTDAAANETSVQISWFQKALSASTSTWNIAYLHNPPFTTSGEGGHPPATWMQLFDAVQATAGVGIDLVLAGHVHSYERLQDDTGQITYIVNGCGGTYESFAEFQAQSDQLKYDGKIDITDPTVVSTVAVYGFYGYMTITATADYLNAQFWGARDPGNVLQAYSGITPSPPSDAGTFTLLDNVVIAKPGATVPYGVIQNATGLVLQSSGTQASVVSVTGAPTTATSIACTLSGTNFSITSDGGTLTFTGAVEPASISGAAACAYLPASPWASYLPMASPVSSVTPAFVTSPSS